MRQWLRDARIKQGLTMAQLAGKLGISESYYSYIEAGERQKKMDLSLVAKIAGLFELPLEDIIGAEAPEEAQENGNA